MYSCNNRKLTEYSYEYSIKFVVEFLRLEALQHFIPIIDTMTKEHLELHWSPFKQVKAWQLSKKYSLALACRLLMSIKDPNHATRRQSYLAGAFSNHQTEEEGDSREQRVSCS